MTAQQSRDAMLIVAEDAAGDATTVLQRSRGSFESRRELMLEAVPAVVAYYADGSAALAADLYEDARESAGVTRSFAAEAIVLDRTVKIRRAVAWATDPLDTGDIDTALSRLSTVVQSEVARPYRDTIITNRRNDPMCVGWKRITRSGACKFCKALADRGAVYKRETAYFAAHTDCMCTCAPVFLGGEVGPEASVIQYIASKRNRTPEQRARIRAWISAYED